MRVGTQSGLNLDPETECEGVRDVEQALEPNGEPNEANAKAEEKAQKTRTWIASPHSEDERQESGAHCMQSDKRAYKENRSAEERTEEGPADDSEYRHYAFLVS